MRSLDPTFPLFPIFAFIGFLVSIIPLPWHIQAWNAGTCSYMIWTAVACLIEFVNSLVWKGHALNLAPIWCDISSKILLGAGAGIPAAALCIARRLYIIASVQTASVTRQDKRRAVICDLLISVGIPVLVMVLHVVVQAHRFDILQDIGCYPVIYNTLPAYFLVFMWPVLLGCISFVYSALALRCFWIRRIQFSQLLSSNTSLNASRYFRLMLLAVANMLFTLPLGIYSIYIGNKGVKLAPWISWEDTHFNFGRVVQVPTVIWRSDPSFETSVELTRWIYVLSALVFFAMFGFASEAQKNYRQVFWWIAKQVGIRRPVSKENKPALPLWRKPVATKTDDLQASLPVFVVHKESNSSKQYPPQSPLSSTSLTRTETQWSSSSKNSDKASPLSPPSPDTHSPPAYSDNDQDRFSQPFHPQPAQIVFPDSSLGNSQERHAPLRPLSSNASTFTIRSMHSLDRVYMDYSASPRAPTPTEIDVPSYHRPFTTPSTYPQTQPHI